MCPDAPSALVGGCGSPPRVPLRWGAVRVVAALALAASIVSLPATALAQACCAAAGLVIPARLRIHEDYGVGLEARARSAFGSFGADGRFATTSSGDLVTQQTVFAALRVFRDAQLALLIPYVQTRRTIPGLTEWGEGLGDIAANARYEFVRAGDYARIPGVALLAGVVFPTGRAPDESTRPLGTDAAGTGTFDPSLGVEIEQTFLHAFISFDGWVSHKTTRTTAAIDESFGLRLTALLAAGYAFDNEASCGAFVTGTHQGGSWDRRANGPIAGTSLALVTAGVAGALPFRDLWRLQGAGSVDVPVSGWGRNEPAGVGLNVSLLKVWM